MSGDARTGSKLPVAPSANAKRTVKRKASADATPVDRVRRICLSLPDTAEKIAWGTPTFRIHDRIFVMYTDNHHRDARAAIWCPVPEGAQAAMVSADPEQFFVPPYVGPYGWLGIRLDRDPDWSAVAEFILEAYRIIEAKQAARRVAKGRRPTKR
jgi:hypothetical protein